MTRLNKQKRYWLLNGALLGMVMWSALSVIETSHRCRELYADLQVLQREQWDMQDNWHRLLLEQGARATYHEVEIRAQSVLGMRIPGVSEVRRVAP